MLHSSNIVQLKPLSKWHLSVVIIIYNNGQIVIYINYQLDALMIIYS